MNDDSKASFQLFDMLDPATEAALRASIRRFGVVVPVVLDQHGRTIDGHHRLRIAELEGVECPSVVRELSTDEEGAELALSLNNDRRHLSPDVRNEIERDLRAQGFSLRAIAAVVGVSEMQVRRDLSTATDVAVPERIVGLDGKSRPSTRPTADELAAIHDLEEDEAEAILDHIGPDATEEEVDQAFEENVESKRLPAITKPDLGDGVSHPARYSDPLFEHFVELLGDHMYVLDPFAGTGRIHELRDLGFTTIGVELEPEWAAMSPDTIVGNALALPFDDATFDAICTSPTYGNRLADHHNAVDPHLRRSYTHDLGRTLHEDNSGAMQWGGEYRAFHEDTWAEAVRVLRPGGVFVLNIKDHIRGGDWQDVAVWHLNALLELGLSLTHFRVVQTGSLRQGANGHLRAVELVIGMEAPWPT